MVTLGPRTRDLDNGECSRQFFCRLPKSDFVSSSIIALKKMPRLTSFHHHFIAALYKIQVIILSLSVLLVVNAAVIGYVEKMPFGDALYFTFVTMLTIGYGDIAPVTLIGRVVAILTGLLGVLINGLIVAVAVLALRRTMEHPADSH
jgi:hypothetical protein